MKKSAWVLGVVPPTVVTVIANGPGSLLSCASAQTPTVLLSIGYQLVVWPPNVAPVIVERFVPVTVIHTPPGSTPLVGLNPVSVGAGMKLNWSATAVALVPPAVVTVMSTVPAGSAGATAVIEVPPPLTVKPLAGVEPKATAVAPVKPVPESVTLVPPEAAPWLTEIDSNRGTGTYPGARTR